MPLEVRAATNHEEAAPFATRTLLGRTINGPVGSEETSRTASTVMTCGTPDRNVLGVRWCEHPTGQQQ